MRLLIVSGIMSFVLSSHQIHPDVPLPEFKALTAAPAPNTSSRDQFLATPARPKVTLANLEVAESPREAEDMAASAPEADTAAEPAAPSPRRKVSVAEMCDTIADAAQSNNLPIGFLIRLIWQESGFNSDIVSSAGAQGVAQFMPRVAAEWGLQDPFDPLQALPASARLLRSLHRQFGNLGLAAAAYNAGSGRIQNWLTKRGKLPEETRSYVLNVTGHEADQWVKTAPHSTSFRIPRRAPCQEIAARFDYDPVPLPLPRLALPAVLSTSASSSHAKIAVANNSVRRPSRARDMTIASRDMDIASPAPIMTATTGSRIHSLTGTAGKRQQLVLQIKSSGKRPVQLASAMHAKNSASKSAAKAPAKGRIQLAMATRPTRR
jgi:hypothetical protein